MFYESNVLYKNIICLHVSMYHEIMVLSMHFYE